MGFGVYGAGFIAGATGIVFGTYASGLGAYNAGFGGSVLITGVTGIGFGTSVAGLGDSGTG